MKRVKLISIILAVSVLLCSCSDKAARRNDEEAVEETEAEVQTIPLTRENLEGTWIDDTGFVCRIDPDNDLFTDAYGEIYDIKSISEDSIELMIRAQSDGAYLNDRTYGLPICSSFTIDASYTEDGILHIFNTSAYNLDSDEGEEYSSNLEDRLSGTTLALAVMGGTLSFNDDLTELTVGTIYGNSEPVQIEFTGTSIIVYQDGESEMIIRTVGEDIILAMDGQIGYGTSARIGMPGSWLLWDASTDEIEILEYSGKPADGAFPVLETSEYQPQMDTDYGEFIALPSLALSNLSGVYINNEVFEQYSYSSTAETTFLIDMRTPLAYQMLARQQIQSNNAGQYTEHVLTLPYGYISVDMYDNEWTGDIISYFEYPEANLNDAYNNWYADLSSLCYIIDLGTDRHNAVIAFEFEGDENYVSVYRVDLYSWEPEELETTFANGYATAAIEESGVYFLGHVDQPEEMTRDNYFDIDPAESEWAATGLAGDIIGLVDIEYIEQSYNGIFVVDSVEDLASLTYFVNTYPRNEEAPECIWVDLIADIDLTGYNWAPLGRNAYGDEDRAFNGIFAGNGHTISGLHIENVQSTNGFFGDIYFATVIGLNIEDAYISGSYSSLMAGSTSTTDYYDCHVSGELPNNFDSGEDLFPFEPDYGNNGYLDCTMSVTNSDGETYEADINGNLPHDNSRNELQDLFDPEHDGTYDYSTDYFFGDDIPNG